MSDQQKQRAKEQWDKMSAGQKQQALQAGQQYL